MGQEKAAGHHHLVHWAQDSPHADLCSCVRSRHPLCAGPLAASHPGNIYFFLCFTSSGNNGGVQTYVYVNTLVCQMLVGTYARKANTVREGGNVRGVGK
jgi:hypothetical protein